MSFMGESSSAGRSISNWAPPESVSPGSLAMLAKNPALLQNYEESPPSGTAMHIFMGEGGRLQRISRETSWEEHAPVSFRRAWEESQRRLTLLESSYFPWVIKVFPEHFECLDLHRFIGLLRRENTKVVVLYRSFLWDWFLSWVAVRQTGIWQQIRTDGEWEKPELASQELSAGVRRDVVQIRKCLRKHGALLPPGRRPRCTL